MKSAIPCIIFDFLESCDICYKKTIKFLSEWKNSIIFIIIISSVYDKIYKFISNKIVHLGQKQIYI